MIMFYRVFGKKLYKNLAPEGVFSWGQTVLKGPEMLNLAPKRAVWPPCIVDMCSFAGKGCQIVVFLAIGEE